jgi:hypothetical protein
MSIITVRHGSGTGLGVPHRTCTRGHRTHCLTGRVLHMYIYGVTRHTAGSRGVDGSRGVRAQLYCIVYKCIYILYQHTTLMY